MGPLPKFIKHVDVILLRFFQVKIIAPTTGQTFEDSLFLFGYCHKATGSYVGGGPQS
jgi:hypothetical protein